MRRGISFFLTLLVVLASLPLKASIHYCCNQIVDIAINAPADGCKKFKSFDLAETPVLKSRGCCKGKSFELLSTDDANISYQLGTISPLWIALNSFFSRYNVQIGASQFLTQFNIPDPPILSIEAQILFDRWLI